MKYPTLLTTKTARLFVQNGTRPRYMDEQTTYLSAYLLKAYGCPHEVTWECASQMAKLIAGENCILIPVPDSKGDTYQNQCLAHSIANHLDPKSTGCVRVKDILTRTKPTESQCARHRKGKTPLTPEQLNICTKPHKPFDLRPIYFVDNVITSGATIQACHDALGFGTGLCYAEALRRA